MMDLSVDLSIFKKMEMKKNRFWHLLDMLSLNCLLLNLSFCHF